LPFVGLAARAEPPAEADDQDGVVVIEEPRDLRVDRRPGAVVRRLAEEGREDALTRQIEVAGEQDTVPHRDLHPRRCRNDHRSPPESVRGETRPAPLPGVHDQDFVPFRMNGRGEKLLYVLNAAPETFLLTP